MRYSRLKARLNFRKYTEHMIMTVFLIGIALSMLISNSIFNCYMKYFQRLTNLCQYFQNHLDLDQTSAEQIQFRIWMLAEVIISNVFQC